MTDTTLISVRGEARRTVAPDQGVLFLDVQARRADRSAALEAVGAGQRELEQSLADLGGVVRTVDTTREPLTWTAGSLNAHDQRNWDERKGDHSTGWLADLRVRVFLRDLARVGELLDAVAAVADVQVQHVAWEVDRDNAMWPQVRAAAIRDSIEKARHYAGALGGTVTRIEQVADTGLLGVHSRERESGGEPMMYAQSVAASGSRSGPSLDPVPQEIGAVVEARFTATVDAL